LFNEIKQDELVIIVFANANHGWDFYCVGISEQLKTFGLSMKH
jgi:hypothetical protein